MESRQGKTERWRQTLDPYHTVSHKTGSSMRRDRDAGTGDRRLTSKPPSYVAEYCEQVARSVNVVRADTGCTHT
jgi:hypothetical protein